MLSVRMQVNRVREDLRSIPGDRGKLPDLNPIGAIDKVSMRDGGVFAQQ